MVEFGTGYSMPMDREFSHHGHAHEENAAPAEGSTNDIGVNIGDFGMSLGLGPVPNVQAIKSKLYAGGKKLEFVFTGMGKGSGQGQTPEMYGKKQRQALSEIAKANRVDFTTHATVGVYGLAGMDQQGNFSKTSKNFSLQEIKRAIEFASDVSEGGPIVVHTGEFQRPVVDSEWNQHENDPWKGKFRMYEGEEGRTSFRVVDSRTGSTIQEARKNRKVSRPVWKRYQEGDDYWGEHEGKEYVDENKEKVKPGDYIDYFGNKVEMASRVPEFDPQTDSFKITQMGWEDLVKESKELTERARKFWRENKGKSSDVWQKEIWTRFKDAKSEDEIKIQPEEAYVIASMETNAAHARGWALQYGGAFDEEIDRIKKLKKARALYEKIEEAATEEERELLKTRAGREFGDLIPPESKLPTEVIDQQLRHLKNRMEQAREASASQSSQAAEAMETIRHVESAESYALKEAFDSYAQSAINAMLHSDKLEKEGKLKKPFFIALENLFPESYGAHPDELMKLVKGSRDKMVGVLKEKYNMTEEQARKESEEHINTTLDTGHMNMWRKYWINDPKKTMSDNDKEFDKWMLDKLGEMAKKKMIGHVHIDDNYGYHDDHLAPGEGNAPIKEMVRTLKENGYNGELIIEPGADYTTDLGGFHSVMKTWRLFGSPVYSSGGIASGPKGRGWGQVGYGWFGQNAPPYFSFGGYSPSEDWTLWSNVPLE